MVIMKLPFRKSQDKVTSKKKRRGIKLPFKKSKPVVSVIRLEGVILSGGRMRQSQLSDESVAPFVEKAFVRGKPVAIALIVNSPGGSPVQSSLIAARIIRLSKEKDIPVYTFVEDVAASGGYWLAAIGDEIYADENSIVGSIGVISASFGFNELLKKMGVERRVHTSGDEKSILDPFLPENPEDVEKLKEIQHEIHQNFIDYVSERRKEKVQDDLAFTGRFWTGKKAMEIGLVDQIGHMVPVMKEKFGDKVKFNFYAKKKKFLSSLSAQITGSFLDNVKVHSLWEKYNL